MRCVHPRPISACLYLCHCGSHSQPRGFHLMKVNGGVCGNLNFNLGLHIVIGRNDMKGMFNFLVVSTTTHEHQKQFGMESFDGYACQIAFSVNSLASGLSASTSTVCPSVSLPSSISWQKASSTEVWMSRFSGRAPNCTS